MIRNLFGLFFLCVVGLLLPGSCKKFTTVDPPSGLITAGKLFTDDAGANSAMVGVYSDMMNNVKGLMNGNISLDAGLSADDLDYLPSLLPDSIFRLNRLTATDVAGTSLFTSFYLFIQESNAVLANLSVKNGVSADVRSQLTGEAEFDRALLYFYLVNLYGGVPLALGTNPLVNDTLVRLSPDRVYAQVIADLQDAVARLPVDYVISGGSAGSRARPNRAAALALLARVWLYRGQWAAAESAASQVIGDGRYLLEPNLDRVFLASSREAIWQLQPLHATGSTGDGYAYLVQRPPGRPNFFLPAPLLAAFEPGDQRRVHWAKNTVFFFKPYTYPYKYKTFNSDTANLEYEMVLRLGEQYLVRAEARARQGNLAGGLADLDVIRARAGLPGAVAADTTALLSAILRERRVELFAEWGHRWLDLKRLGQADAVLKGKAGWQAYDTLYPIPASQMVANPRTTQNPGYQ